MSKVQIVNGQFASLWSVKSQFIWRGKVKSIEGKAKNKNKTIIIHLSRAFQGDETHRELRGKHRPLWQPHMLAGTMSKNL